MAAASSHYNDLHSACGGRSRNAAEAVTAEMTHSKSVGNIHMQPLIGSKRKEGGAGERDIGRGREEEGKGGKGEKWGEASRLPNHRRDAHIVTIHLGATN